MNKIFKVIWNPATGSYSVASETAKSRGKKSGRSKLLISALVAGGMLSSFGASAGEGIDGGTALEDPTQGSHWLAIGEGAKATTISTAEGYATAIGFNALADGEGSTAFGYATHASGDRAIAFGQFAEAAGNRAMAFGSGANAIADHSIAFGGTAYTGGKYSIAIGRGAKVEDNADYAASYGYMSKASGLYSLAFGSESQADTDNAIAMGQKAHARGKSSLALGAGSNSVGDDSIAFGANSYAQGAQSLAFGAASQSLETNAIAIGNASQANNINAIALGQGSNAGVENGVAIGSGANATGINSVALGSESVATEDNTVSVGSSTDMRRIVNMAAGAISQDSTDAINGSQLYAISKSVADRLGGGSSVNPTTGIVNAPNYKLRTGTYSNVGAALTAIDNATLQWSTRDSAYSAAHDTETTSKITNVKDGTIGAGSTDAVNGSQLNTTNGKVDTNTTNIATNTTNISNLGGRVDTLNTTVNANSTSITNLGDSLTDLQEDALLWNGTAFSAAHGQDATSKITNVKDADLTADSTDAVNGSQLKTTNDAVATNTTNIANNTSNIATNTTNISNLTETVTNLGEDALKWDKDNGVFTAAHGTEATSKITNVKDADLTADSTDAVNGSQLKTTNDAVATNTTNIANNTSNIATNTTNISNLTETVTNLGEDALKWDKDNGVFTAAHGTEATSKITNILDGTVTATSSDAINGSQLYDLSSNIASYFGGNASVNTDGVFTGPTYKIGETNYYNVGDALAAINSSFSTSLGDALLWDTSVEKFSAKHGTNGDASVITDVANGDVSSTSSDAVNGSQLYTTNKYVVDALGGGAEVNADGSISAPTYTIANTDYDNVGDALNAIDTTLDDALLWDADAGENGAFSAAHGKDKTASVITNVANGAISATSSDAVNGSQLYTTNQYIVDALGGDAEVNADGTITAPTYTIANAEYNNVGDALDALDDNALLWDETANGGAGAYNASHDGKASIITNVADGSISEDSTDAVNGSQLNATNMMIEQNSQIINQLAGNTDATYIEENGAGINYVRTNDNGLAFNDASASGVGATAVGYNAVASGASSVAIGQNSSSTVDTGIALGSSSVSSRVIAKGSRDTSVTENGVVIGYDTTDGELLGALSIGDDGKYRQIINVADGSEAHDAVTVRQLQNAIGAVATTPTKYFHANSTAEDSLAVGEDSLAMGAKTVVNGNAGIGIGLNTLVLADAINGIAIGSNARANHANSIAMGNGSQTTRGAQTGYTAYNMDAPQNSVGEFSVGSEDGQRQITNVAAGSADTDAVNVGQLKVTDERVTQNTQSITNLNNQVTNLDTRVTNIENGIGDIVTTGSTKYFKTNTDGVDANAQGKDSVAIGSGSIAAADNSVALGTGSVATEENTISVGSSTNQRRITNVAAGVNATDAVNVSQLKSSEAGGVRYDTKADGSIDYSNITLGGGNGSTTRISNVSAGVNNNDAVNYAQLKQSVQETKQYTDQRMVEMDNKLSKTESKLSGGIASAMAMTGLPQAYTPGASMASIGGGTYNGESAVALGVSMVSANGRWVYKLQGSTNSQGEYSAALGAGIQW
ncbi:TPA: YadA-like family protein [Escherichia coli]|uniref:YadA-like family protein n=3 Tax=Escherichia coli TaxID=562 RepID=UPI000BE8C307|nr:YadA-like family protein [Escherichia coli]EFC4191796.1 adhesin [Escherichia coli]EFD0646378.1 adhesin [Escherichia coli]EFI9512529.1 adhesin [Escherichia coli]EHI0591187.1 adhesin [Escherichia coli]EIQ0496881.1 YadA-like family protein [Escherichia coli]